VWVSKLRLDEREQRPETLIAMLANHSSSHLPDNISKRDIGIPDAVIAGFLGLGLGYSEWPAEVKKRGYEWSPGLEKVIIERELEYFRPEIQLLMSEETIKVHPSGVRSNSLNTILKRLKGEPWMGRPAEREERLRAHRLLGKDAKYVTLYEHVFFATSDANVDGRIAGPAVFRIT